ncbi:hypothetical protein GP486_007746 [Trichoglossum hirsutum]|uniref:R3H domain protein n=1 Tax=Trichoglossum hirsutum TaxID=265104 RepID=A0A9P8IFB3_9PEZI|nr:hypothetical protein GP486_007746 [Trichoglossum hirsutum]
MEPKRIWRGEYLGRSGSDWANEAFLPTARSSPYGRLDLTELEPQTWLDQPALPSVNPFSGLGAVPLGQSMRAETMNSDPDEELIPTAIVIKNIPFAVKKEQLVQLMTDLNLPLPYAFNYHFDNGVFRGLAFANFTTAEETATVIENLNHFELQGRKLRVEYKKMLPLAERERIEREKRERRGQLEEQHRPMGASQLHQQPSMNSLSSTIPATSPSPVSMRSAKPDVDLNDPQTLQFYSQLLLFRDDMTREALIFPSTLSPAQRRIVHTLAHHMALAHVSRGNGEQRQVHVFRAPAGNSVSPPIPQIPTSVHPGESQRRVLNRAATMDFSDARGSDSGLYSTMRGQSALLDIPGSPGGGGIAAGQNLRAAKSFADLRSYTPSPVPSSASFPAALGAGISRYTEYGAASVASTTPSLTPTATPSNREESMLVNGLGSMSLTTSLGGSLGVGGGMSRDSRDPRGILSLDRDGQHPVGTGINSAGSRSFSMGYDDQSRSQATPVRQPRGPAPERGTGFSRRQNGHHNNRGGSGGELDVQSGVEIVVE